MPFFAAFTAAEAAMAAEAAIAAEAALAAEAAAAASAASTAAAPVAATAAAAPAAGIMGAEAAAANALSGLGSTGAGMAAEALPAVEAATAVGGQGAGTAATQAAMESTMQTAAGMPGGITSVPEPAGLQQLTSAGDFSQGLPPGFDQQLQNVNSLTQGPGVQVASTDPSAGIKSIQGGTSNPMLNEYGEAYSLTNNTPVTTEALQLPPGAAPEPGYTVAGGQQGPGIFSKLQAMYKESPFMTGAAMYTGAYKLGLLEPNKAGAPEKKTYGKQYSISDDFQGSEATPNVYTPSYRTYAEGGVMAVGGPSSEVPEPRKVVNPMATISTMADGGMPGYAKGGTLSDTLDFYKKMTEDQKPSTSKGATAPRMEDDVGIYYDQDPDTRYQDALTAAQIRQAKLNKRSNMQVPSGGVMKRPTPMGQINLSPPGGKAQDGGGATEAARGGIMQARDSSLGGYAAGGNPRLLKGPGDGMSDNIPAMIGRKQPARLADGEFVIPADVVSHLGNGSTEAGAKRLHEMMTKVRKDRTGNPKQGKQINPHKYMPK